MTQPTFKDLITNSWKAVEVLSNHPDYQQIVRTGLLDEPETVLAEIFGILEQIQQAFDYLEDKND